MNRLKQLRLKNGYTQQYLASWLGIDRTTYVKYERGYSEPSMDKFIRLSDLYRVSLDYLVGRTDEPTYIATTTFDDGLVLEAEGTTKEPPTLEERERLEAAIKGGLYSTGPILPDDELEKRIEAVLRRMLADEKDNGNKDL